MIRRGLSVKAIECAHHRKEDYDMKLRFSRRFKAMAAKNDCSEFTELAEY